MLMVYPPFFAEIKKGQNGFTVVLFLVCVGKKTTQDCPFKETLEDGWESGTGIGDAEFNSCECSSSWSNSLKNQTMLVEIGHLFIL